MWFTEQDKIKSFMKHIIEPIKDYPAYTWKECIDGVLRNHTLDSMYVIVATRVYRYLAYDDEEALEMAATMYYAKIPYQLGFNLIANK